MNLYEKQQSKYVLKVPIVNFIFRSLAHYPEFLKIAWGQIRQNMLTVNMEEASKLLRYPKITFPIAIYQLSEDYNSRTVEH
jgi:hypothetical protein